MTTVLGRFSTSEKGLGILPVSWAHVLHEPAPRSSTKMPLMYIVLIEQLHPYTKQASTVYRPIPELDIEFHMRKYIRFVLWEKRGNDLGEWL